MRTLVEFERRIEAPEMNRLNLQPAESRANAHLAADGPCTDASVRIRFAGGSRAG
jgi:hypothetical protein